MPSTPRPNLITHTPSSSSPIVHHQHHHMSTTTSSTPIATTPRSGTPRAGAGGSRAVGPRLKGQGGSRKDSPARKENGAAAAGGRGGGGMLGSDLDREGLSGISGGEDVGPSRRQGEQVEVPVGVPLPKGMLNVPGLRTGQSGKNEERKAGGRERMSGGVQADRMGRLQLEGGMSTSEGGTEGEERRTPVRSAKQRGNKKKSAGVDAVTSAAGKGRAVDGDTSLEDVFTSHQQPGEPLAPSANRSSPFDISRTQSPRRPRHQRTRSEPLSIISGFDGEEHAGKQVKPSVTAGAEKTRKKRKKKEKDRDKEKGEGEVARDSTDGEMVGRMKGLGGLGAGGAKPRTMGLRMPLAEEDDVASVISGMDGNTSDDAPQQGTLEQDYRRYDDHYTAVVPAESDYASLSKSAPGDKSYFMMSRGGRGDGYTSGSGYQSGGYGENERNGGGAAARKSQRRNVVEDESAVWEMPGEEERGSGAGLTWQQAMLAGGGAKQKSAKSSDNTNRPSNPKSSSTPSGISKSFNNNPQTSARKTTTGFNARKAQARDEETFGTTAIAPFVPNPSFNAVKPYTPGHGSPGPRGGGGKMSSAPAAALTKVYAGPTFQNSPSADSLPAPKLKQVSQ